MLGNFRHGGAVILGNAAVGADVVEQRFHSCTGQMDAVAGLHIAALGVAGGGVLQHLGAVQELPALFFAHFDEGLVVLVHLGLGQALVGVLLPQRRNGVDDDVRTGVRLDDALNACLVVFDKISRLVAGAEVVGAKGDDDPLGLHACHSLGHGDVAAGVVQLHAGIGGQALGAHAHRADGVIVGAEVEHAVHAGGIAVAQEKRFVHIGLARITAFRQDGGRVGRGVDGVFLFIVAALGNDGLRLYGRVGSGVLAASEPAHQEKGNTYAGQQHQAANDQHNVHFCPEIQPHFGF